MKYFKTLFHYFTLTFVISRINCCNITKMFRTLSTFLFSFLFLFLFFFFTFSLLCYRFTRLKKEVSKRRGSRRKKVTNGCHLISGSEKKNWTNTYFQFCSHNWKYLLIGKIFIVSPLSKDQY